MWDFSFFVPCYTCLSLAQIIKTKNYYLQLTAPKPDLLQTRRCLVEEKEVKVSEKEGPSVIARSFVTISKVSPNLPFGVSLAVVE
jgi:hypothetical protein